MIKIVDQILESIEADIDAGDELTAYCSCSDLRAAMTATRCFPQWHRWPKATGFFTSVEEVNNALYSETQY